MNDPDEGNMTGEPGFLPAENQRSCSPIDDYLGAQPFPLSDFFETCAYKATDAIHNKSEERYPLEYPRAYSIEGPDDETTLGDATTVSVEYTDYTNFIHNEPNASEVSDGVDETDGFGGSDVSLESAATLVNNEEVMTEDTTSQASSIAVIDGCIVFTNKLGVEQRIPIERTLNRSVDDNQLHRSQLEFESDDRDSVPGWIPDNDASRSPSYPGFLTQDPASQPWMVDPKVYSQRPVSSIGDGANFRYQARNRGSVGAISTNYFQHNPNVSYFSPLHYGYQSFHSPMDGSLLQNYSPTPFDHVPQHRQPLDHITQSALGDHRASVNSSALNINNNASSRGFQQINPQYQHAIPYYDQSSQQHQQIIPQYQPEQGFYQPVIYHQVFSQGGLAHQPFHVKYPVQAGQSMYASDQYNTSSFDVSNAPFAYEGLEPVYTGAYIPTGNQINGPALPTRYADAENRFASLPVEQPRQRAFSRDHGFEQGNQMFMGAHQRLQNVLAEKDEALPSFKEYSTPMLEVPITPTEITQKKSNTRERSRKTIRAKLEGFTKETGLTTAGLKTTEPSRTTLMARLEALTKATNATAAGLGTQQLRLAGRPKGKNGSNGRVYKVAKQPYEKAVPRVVPSPRFNKDNHQEYDRE